MKWSESIPMAREKAIGEMVALFSLGDRPELVRLRDTVRGMLFGNPHLADVNWVEPSEYHITSVYMLEGASLDGIQRLDYYTIPAFSVVIDGIGTFDTPDGYAVYARVRNSGDISSMQSLIFDQLSNYGESGIPSSFSMPWNYTPHITLCYSPTPIIPFDIEPFSLMVNRFEISDSDRYPVVIRIMKSVEERQIEKAVQLEVIEKSIHYNEAGDLVIPVIGVPFKGPIDGKKDLAGDWFYPGTDIGSTREVNAFYDHGRDGNYILKELKSMGLSDDEINALGPDFGFGKHDIGVAQKAETTEDGIVFNIIVNRRTRYIKALEKAARQRLLGASGEYKAFEYDESEPGKVKYAPIAGMVLSPTPYNVFAEIQKSVVMEDDEMGAKKAAEEVVKNTEAEAGEVEPVEAEEKTVNPITKAIQAKKETVEKAVEEKQEEDEEDEVSLTVSELAQKVAEQSQVMKAVEDSVQAFQTDLQTALPELADMITKSVLAGIEEIIEEAVTRKIAMSKLEAGNVVEKSITRKASGGGIQKSVKSASAPLHQQAASMANYPGSN